MSGWILGFIMIISGVFGMLAVYFLSHSSSQTVRKGEARRHKLDHEYEKRGFIEKSQSEGIIDIPHASPKHSSTDSYEDDPFFSSEDGERNNTPGDDL